MEVELIEQASSEISEYNATEAGLADLRARMANVEYCVTTTAGMAVAKADRAEVRGLRTGLEAMRKQIKAPALAHCKLIDAEAARITAELLKLEEPIDAQIKAEEQRKETERSARELAERNRITEIHRHIAEIRDYQALATGCRTAAAIQALIDKLWMLDLNGLEEFEDDAKTARLATMHAMESARDQKLEDEAERVRVKAEQDAAAAELAKARAELAAAKDEQERIAKANRDAATAEADRLATARQAFEDEQDKARAERQAFDARVKAKQDEDDLAAYKEAFATVVIAQAAIETVADDDDQYNPFNHESYFQKPITTILPPRPTDRELLAAIESTFAVDAKTAFHWLQNVNMKTLQAELIKEH